MHIFLSSPSCVISVKAGNTSPWPVNTAGFWFFFQATQVLAVFYSHRSFWTYINLNVAFRQVPHSPWQVSLTSPRELPQYQYHFWRSAFVDSNKQLSVGRNADREIRGHKGSKTSRKVPLLWSWNTFQHWVENQWFLAFIFIWYVRLAIFTFLLNMGLGDFITVGI